MKCVELCKFHFCCAFMFCHAMKRIELLGCVQSYRIGDIFRQVALRACWRRGGLMVSALDSGASSPVSSALAGPQECVRAGWPVIPPPNPHPPPSPTRREKPWERGWGSGLCVSKIAEATLFSKDEEIVNPNETAVSRGASLVEPEKAFCN